MKNSTFLSLKITFDTLIDIRNETSKHHFLKSVKINKLTLVSVANVPVRFRAQQRAKYSSLSLELVHAFSCAYIELWMHLRSLESTQEARVALGYRLEQLLRYCQTKTHCCGHIVAHDVSHVAQTGKHLLRTQNVSDQNQKHFLCPGHKICVRNKCCARGQTGKHLCRQQCVRNNVSSFASTFTLLSCSPSFPRASVTRYTHAKHEPILYFTNVGTNQ